MRYQNNGHVTDDVMSKVMWGSTVSYTSDSLASYYLTVPTVALMLRPSDRLTSVMYVYVTYVLLLNAVRPRAKVTIDSL